MSTFAVQIIINQFYNLFDLKVYKQFIEINILSITSTLQLNDYDLPDIVIKYMSYVNINFKVENKEISFSLSKQNTYFLSKYHYRLSTNNIELHIINTISQLSSKMGLNQLWLLAILFCSTLANHPVGLYSTVLVSSAYNMKQHTNLMAQIIMLECKEVDDDQQIYICTQKAYSWLLPYLDADVKENEINHTKTQQVQIQLEKATDQIQAKLRNQMANITIIQANMQQHDKVILHYITISQPNPNNFTFNHSQVIPVSLKPLQASLPGQVIAQINRQFGHKRSTFFEYIVIVIIVIVIVVGAVYFWKRKQMSSKIDSQPVDLKEAMMAKLDIQQQENRKDSVGTIVRSSQPPPKSKI